MLREATKRDVLLNCHISEQNKRWLAVMSDKLKRPMGDIVDEIISKIREETREVSKLPAKKS